MPIKELSRYAWETKDGSTGVKTGGKAPVKYPRGAAKVAQRLLSQHNAVKVALEFGKDDIVYYRKSGKMKNPDEMLEWVLKKKKS